jgi:hypothetical protein
LTVAWCWKLDTAAPALAADCRADIDRLLDRRSWLTLPVSADHLETGQRPR